MCLPNVNQQRPSSPSSGTTQLVVMEGAMLEGARVIKLGALGEEPQHPAPPEPLARTVTVVDPSYRDHVVSDLMLHGASGGNISNINNDDEQVVAHRSRHTGGIAVTFPEKLFDMLNAAATVGFEHIISWQPHGRSFLIHYKNLFVETIMPRYVLMLLKPTICLCTSGTIYEKSTSAESNVLRTK